MAQPTDQLNRWELACPRCQAVLGGPPARAEMLPCPSCGASYPRCDDIWRFLTPERAGYFAPFLRDYTAIRRAEGYGSADPAYYRRLPEASPSDRLAWQWRMRARSFVVLQRRVLAPLHQREIAREMARGGANIARSCAQLGVPSRAGAGLRVLDLGAGVGWLSNRMALLGHAPCAVDLTVDACDGLGAAGHYAPGWPRLQAEYDRLPLAGDQADLIVYNASLHYSADYRATLAEALRVLRRGGRIVVMDSPIYRRDASGRQMIAERQAAFERDHGTRSDALPSIGYLTWTMLGDLARELRLRWRAYTPWYGWRWALRPWQARLKGAREPSRFALLVAKRLSD